MGGRRIQYGQRFGRLVVSSKHGHNAQKAIVWNCTCTCGNVVQVSSQNLGRSTNSCGCLKTEVVKQRVGKQLQGRVFGRLTVLRQCGISKHQKTLWSCRCICGTFVHVVGSKLLSHHTRSCGCLVKEYFQSTHQFNGRSISKSGKAFLDALEQRFGITIEREFYLGGKYYDGRCGRLLIEIDCDYWHKRMAKNDRTKDAIALKHDYTIVRMNVDNQSQVQRQLRKYIPSFEKVLRLKV